MSGALRALGPQAVDPLLEVFRSVKASRVGENGAIEEDHEGKDGAPASALVRIPGAIERLKSSCRDDEFERILLVAHDYGDSSNPEVNRALGEIGTPRAVRRLVFVLWQHSWGEEARRPAREALIKVGKAAHPALTDALKIKAPANREFQTSLRKEVLQVLREIGDGDCIPAIREVADSDPLVSQEARDAMKTIGQRTGGIELPPEPEGPRPLPLKTISKTDDPYVDACLQVEFPEFYDDRDWFEMPEAKAIPNAGDTDQALQLAEQLRQKHPDFDFVYYWLGTLWDRRGDREKARQHVLDGMRLSKSKQSLYTKLGDLEWKWGNLPEAMKWWAKSVVVQVGSQHATDYVAFLHLSYVAEALGIQAACSQLRAWEDRIRTGQIRLTAQAANELYAATRRQATPAMRHAIELLYKHYLST